jgi:DNA-binding CsgD family transcriptional regulator
MKVLLNTLSNFAFSCLFLFQTTAQEIPPIVPYLPNDYGADNQIWDISQSAENYIYAANTQGLLEFNGANWRLYTAPNNSIIRSVKVIDNKIFTGCFMDFGFWERDIFGNLNYTSLTDRFNLIVEEDEEFWNITELDDWMVFQSYSRIYLLNLLNKESKIIKSDSQILNMINFEDMIYFQKSGVGLFKIENGSVVVVNNDQVLKQSSVIDIFRVNKKMLILTNNSGIFVLENGSLKEWAVNDKLKIKDITFYSAAQLNDDTLFLGTISNGIFHLDSEGNLIERFNQNNGLSNNTILSIFEDSHSDIWLGLDYGINYIDRNSKFKVYYSKQGQLGTIYNAIIFNDLLYLGTNQGLFYKNINKNEAFSFIEGTKGQVWTLKEVNGLLLCGHDKGTFIINNAKVIDKITEAEGTWDFKTIPDNENLILQGNYGGLNILEKKGGSWKFRNNLDGIDMSCRFFEIQGDKIFINHEFKGLFEVTNNSEFNKAQSLNITNTVDKGIGSSLLKYSDDLIYSSSEGVFKYDDNQQFVKDSIFSSLFSSYRSLSTLLQINGEPNKIWRFADDNILIISPGSVSSKPQIETIPISESLRNVVAGFENLSKISNDEYLIGTSNGYIIYNSSNLEPTEDYKIEINSVQANKIDEPKSQLNLSEKPELDNNTNNIEFNFSVPFYGEIVKSKYQYQLVGLSDNWSPWSTKPNQIFENLSFGNYTFNVRGKIGNKLSTNIASYSFEINRPWYITNLAMIIYAILSIFLILIIHNFYKSYYVKQQTKLLDDTQRTLDMKELESNQKLMELKNDKLKQDIENKNRELAISTMSLIKKNEFLNQIKNELKKAENPKINSVIKLINTNINNTDDWKFFEEAFNNADKDFLKKIKILHPDLTPNDLKLCAYLRLNLSSKEIAPLLNISSRSVEVKRYRLRKKMDLPHEYSLTNYILEI